MAAHQRMVQERSRWDPLFQELKDLVRPDTGDFVGGSSRPEDARRRIYDGTAPWALEQLAAGIHSAATSPVDRWFGFGVAGTPLDQLDHQAKAWLELTSETLYAHFSNPFAAFNQSYHESYLDLGGLGNAVIYEWLDLATNALMFRTYPVADCWIEEDHAGRVTRLHRRFTWTVEQVQQAFGQLPEKLAKLKMEDKVTLLHCVYEREDRVAGNRHPLNRAYASVYLVTNTEEIVSESGYDWMPYHTPRWTKLAGDTYGRPPALSVLPDIRMVNAMSKTLIVAAQKITDPPLMVPDDGFLLPLKTHPGGINYRRPGTEDIIPMPTPQRIDIGIEMIEQRRESIRRGFFIDWIVRPTKKERQTAQEIMDDRNQMLSMLGPVIGRLQAELLGPTIRLSYNLLARHNLLPPMPASLDGAELELTYISPSAKAQSTVRGQGLQAYLTNVTQLLPVMPGLMDSINEDALNAELQDLTDVPRRVLNDPKTTAARRQAREEQQQLAQAAELAPAVGKTAKDLASARQLGGI